jgi:site-specific DNA-adenine methylase
LIGRAEDKQGSVIYVDPPYFENFKEEDHVDLARALRRFRKTRVVLSYYLHPLLKDLYLDHGWAIIHQDVQKNLSATKGAVTAPEVLLVNGV